MIADRALARPSAGVRADTLISREGANAMIDKDHSKQEVDLFRAITIRDIEERDMLNGSSDPIFKMKYSLESRSPGLFDSWCPSKGGKD
jgi:hypothetical protein